LTDTNENEGLGLVMYADGSFLPGRAGWGLHGYTFLPTPLEKKPKGKYLPSEKGYLETKALDQTVTPVAYINAYGRVETNPTNNTAELQAVIEAIRMAHKYPVTHLHILSDSEYVRKGLTKYVKQWLNNGWTKSDGQPVANQDYWKELLDVEREWKSANRTLELVWVKGHAGEPGNEAADANAKTASKSQRRYRFKESPAAEYAAKLPETNPLIMKMRMLFNIGGEGEIEKPEQKTYYFYQLGRMQTYGIKQHDTVVERHNKSDLLLGRRIADATFCVLQPPTSDEFLESLMEMHSETHKKETIELAVARLDNAYKSSVQQRIRQLGPMGLIGRRANHSLVTPQEDLVTKTLDPPRLAWEAVSQFTILQERLEKHVAGKSGKSVTTQDITDKLYEVDDTGKKTKVKLLKHITNNLPYIEIPVEVKGQTITVRLVLGVDIPMRNPLAKIAELNPKVHVLVVATGPAAYSFAVVFETEGGNAIYQSPYTQFVLPLTENP
jgi:ribonuclease HI